MSVTYRSLITIALFFVSIPAVRAAGDAFVCPVESTTVAPAVSGSSDDLFTRPESGVPVAKRTMRRLYLTAQDAYDMVSEASNRILFIDVRTRGELQFIGMPTLVDANVPFLVETSPTQWDDANSTFKLAVNPKFVESVDQRVALKGLTRDDQVVLICQGGLRAARAANALTQAGYTKVYTVIDGFEGDPVADGPHKGERLVNGWRNAGLPWTTRLERGKMYGLD